MNYKLSANGAISLDRGTWFQFADGNRDYEAYKVWLAAGNTPVQADPVDPTAPVWSEFRERRDLYLSRLAGISVRHRSDPVIPSACDAMTDGLLSMPSDPTLMAIADPQVLVNAVVAAINQLVRAQLTDPSTAPAVKAALDQVFK